MTSPQLIHLSCRGTDSNCSGKSYEKQGVPLLENLRYEVNFLPLFYVQNIKITVYVENLHNFNFFF